MAQRYKKYLKLVVSSASIVVSALVVKKYLLTDNIKASWTSSYEPTVKWDHNWDKRDPSFLAKTNVELTKSKTEANLTSNVADKNAKSQDDMEIGKKSTKARRHIFLIRHGQYQITNREKDKQVLTPLGREQAELCGKRLYELAAKYKFTKIHHSTMIRAIETAQLINKELNEFNLPIRSDALLSEGAPIPPEPAVDHWKPDIYEFFQDGSRIEAAFRKYFYRAVPEQLEDSYEIIVCHANVIRYFFCRALQFPPEAWLRFDLGHGSITHLIIKPDGRVGCKALGEVGFLAVPKSTS